MHPVIERLLLELEEAERKAWDALGRYKFQMFGYWAAVWVHLNRIGQFNRPNPWSDLVRQAKGEEALRYEYSTEDSEASRQVKRFLADLLFDRHIRINELAARLNVSSERMNKWLNESCPNSLPAYILPLFTHSIGPELLAYIAKESGYAIVKLPDGEISPGEAVAVGSHALHLCGEALETYSHALTDLKVTARELREIKERVREVLSAMIMLEVVAEEMRKNA